MPGRPPKVDHLREGFIASGASAQGLVDSVLDMSGINPNSECPRLHTEHARRVVELAFLGLVSAWEEFLEQVFVRYTAGATTDSGFAPPLRMGATTSIAHSYHVISGDPDYDPTRHYAKFSDPKWVIATSKLYFEQGSPFSTRLHPKLEPLQHAVKLRNRVAHTSRKVRSEFKRTALIHLGRGPGDSLTQGYRVGDLLVAPAERIFGQQARNQSLSYFQAYRTMYESLAVRVVP